MPASIQRTLEYVLLTVQQQLALRDSLFDAADSLAAATAARALGYLDARGAPTMAGIAAVQPTEMARRLAEPSQAPTAPYSTIRELTKQDLPTARALGLPRGARSLYDRLCGESPGEWSTLLQQCRAHAKAFVDRGTPGSELAHRAQQLMRGLVVLHGRIDGHLDPVLADRLTWIAARYFVITMDGSPDFEPGGLDDDVAVFNAICEQLDHPDLVVGVR